MAEIKITGSVNYECPECENEIELGDNYCSDCGEPIEWKEE